jgi:hypothetical protein
MPLRVPDMAPDIAPAMASVRTLLPLALALGVLASPLGARAAALQLDPVSQALDFSIVIPEVLRILENRTPKASRLWTPHRPTCRPCSA